MVVRAVMLTVLSLGLSACVPGTAPPAGPPRAASSAGWPEAIGRAEAVGDFIVIRRTGAVSVAARLDGKPLWSVPQRAEDPITKARLAQGSIVVVRRSQKAEVYELKTGTLRFSKENAGAIGVSWTTLYADSAVCQPDCLLRAYDLATGAQRWVGPKSLPGKVMAELGEPLENSFTPADVFDGPLRAQETSVIAVRTAEGVSFLDAASGQETSRVPLPLAGMALGSGRTLVEWSAVKNCEITVIGRNAGTGEITWQALASTRPSGQPSACPGGWRPGVADGLIVLSDPRGQAKLLEVDSGKTYWNASSFGDPQVAATRTAIITYGPGHLTALRPDTLNPTWANRLWYAGVSESTRVADLTIHFDRLLYTTEYEGSPYGVGWVRDLASGRRLWYADSARPLGVDGDRVIVETPDGEIRLEQII